jgi:hypothetical protein
VKVLRRFFVYASWQGRSGEHESLVDLYMRAMESARTPDVRAA